MYDMAVPRRSGLLPCVFQLSCYELIDTVWFLPLRHITRPQCLIHSNTSPPTFQRIVTVILNTPQRERTVWGPELPGPCSCDSAPGDNAWSNFKTEPPAEWTSRTYTPAYYRTTFAATLPMLLQLPYTSILSCSMDWMHCKYLGVDQYFLGSVLMLMVSYLMTGDSGRSIAIFPVGQPPPLLLYHRPVINTPPI